MPFGYKVVDLRFGYKPAFTGQVTGQAYLFPLVISINTGKQRNYVLSFVTIPIHT